MWDILGGRARTRHSFDCDQEKIDRQHSDKWIARVGSKILGLDNEVDEMTRVLMNDAVKRVQEELQKTKPNNAE